MSLLSTALNHCRHRSAPQARSVGTQCERTNTPAANQFGKFRRIFPTTQHTPRGHEFFVALLCQTSPGQTSSVPHWEFYTCKMRTGESVSFILPSPAPWKRNLYLYPARPFTSVLF